MKILEEIRVSKRKPKELVAYICEEILKVEKNNGVRNVYRKMMEK